MNLADYCRQICRQIPISTSRSPPLPSVAIAAAAKWRGEKEISVLSRRRLLRKVGTSQRAILATPRPKRGGPDELMVPKMGEELDYWKERKEGHSFSCGAFLGGFSDSGRGRATRVGSQQKRGFLSLNFPPWLWVSVRAIVIASN